MEVLVYMTKHRLLLDNWFSKPYYSLSSLYFTPKTPKYIFIKNKNSSIPLAHSL